MAKAQYQTNPQEIQVYDLSGKLRATLAGTEPIFSDDGRFILTSSGGIVGEDATSSLWDTAGNLHATVRGSPAAFRPDNQRFVTYNASSSLSYLYDLSGHQITTMTGIAPTFSADDQYVITVGYTERLVGSTYGPVYLWNKEGQAVTSIGLNGDRAWFGPNDNRILTAEYDGTLRLWSLEGQLLATIPNGGNIFDMHFSPDGSRIITTNSDGIARQNLINVQDLQAVAACRISTYSWER
jgi:WD40 repeat protein